MNALVFQNARVSLTRFHFNESASFNLCLVFGPQFMMTFARSRPILSLFKFHSQLPLDLRVLLTQNKSEYKSFRLSRVVFFVHERNTR